MSALSDRFYVYVYRIDGDVAYVGKGQGNRAYVHLANAQNRMLRQRVETGRSVKVKIIKSGMTEVEAFRLERRCINKWRDTLCNMTQGTRTQEEVSYSDCLFQLKHRLVGYGDAIKFSNGCNYSLKHAEERCDSIHLRITNLAWLKRELRSVMRMLELNNPSLIKNQRTNNA